MRHYLQQLRECLTAPRHWHRPSLHHVMHTTHTTAHASYFAAAWHEAHGLYGTFAGVCLIFTILSIFTKEAE